MIFHRISIGERVSIGETIILYLSYGFTVRVLQQYWFDGYREIHINTT